MEKVKIEEVYKTHMSSEYVYKPHKKSNLLNPSISLLGKKLILQSFEAAFFHVCFCTKLILVLGKGDSLIEAVRSLEINSSAGESLVIPISGRSQSSWPP